MDVRWITLFCSLAAVCATTTAGAQPRGRDPLVSVLSIEPSTDRAGADYRTFDLPSPDVEPCRRACTEDPTCVAYTYADPGLVSATARCFLKNSLRPATPKRGCTSGARVARGSQNLVELGLSIEPSTDRAGADYQTFDLPQPDVEPCRRACASDPRCAAYTYADPGLVGKQARCFLKDAAPGASPKRGCTSGVRRPHASSPRPMQPPPPMPDTVRPLPPRVGPGPRDCGMGLDDLGCAESRDGAWAIDAPLWRAVVSNVKAERNELQRRDLAVQTIGDGYITARQFMWLLDQIGNELTRLELARELVGHVIDVERALSYGPRFNNSFNRRDFIEIVRGAR